MIQSTVDKVVQFLNLSRVTRFPYNRIPRGLLLSTPPWKSLSSYFSKTRRKFSFLIFEIHRAKPTMASSAGVRAKRINGVGGRCQILRDSARNGSEGVRARSFRLNCGPVIYRAFLAWPVPLDGWITRKVFRPGRLLVAFTLRAATRSFLVRLRSLHFARLSVTRGKPSPVSIVSLRRSTDMFKCHRSYSRFVETSADKRAARY